MVAPVDRAGRLMGLAFVLAFFTFLFGPLVVMGLTAFNSSAFPRVAPWECFTVEWFGVLADNRRLLAGLRNSVFIGLGVVAVTVPLGLAGALLLNRVSDRVRPWYYTLAVSPILVPGVVLGISTLLFWDRIGRMFGASRDSIFYDGFFLTIVGQSTFISAYTLLVFVSRLQRFDTAQEEAALDLGATHWQSFRRILLPFLYPAVASASVLAFLASFENYNTTVFTAISTSTLTKELASKVRYGIDPSISALAVCIIVVTVLAAALSEVFRRRSSKRLAARAPAGLPPPWYREPALVMILLVVVAGTGTTVMAGTIGVDECKVQVRAEKQRRTQVRIEAMRERRAAEAAEAARVAAERGADEDATVIPAPRSYAPRPDAPATAPGERPGTGNFGDLFGGDLAPTDPEP